MGAKQKLNVANLVGALVFAGLLGVLTNSVTVFLLTGSTLLMASWIAGDIRA